MSNEKKEDITLQTFEQEEIKNKSILSNISNTSDNYLEKKSKIIENPSAKNSVSMCENSSNSSRCYLEFAIKEDQPSFCYFLDYGEEFFYCIKNWCSNTNKKSILDCEKYSDADTRLICINNCFNQER
ncbi:MAG: hypothetical protein ACK4J0_01200 [Candidatus Anstonellaceae archaeon]